MHRAQRSRSFLGLWLALAGCLLGCRGVIKSPGDDRAADPGSPHAPDDPTPSGAIPDTTTDPTGRTNPAFLVAPFTGWRSGMPRKLTTRELANTFTAAVGFVPSALDRLPADRRLVEGQSVTSIHEEAYTALANEIHTSLMQDRLTPLVPGCTAAPDEGADNATALSARRRCAQDFVDRVAPIAWRRPLADQERSRMMALYDASERYLQGMWMLVHAIFRSPNFLYLVEIGRGLDTTGQRRLTDFELAARLSYALCQQPPDAVLRQAAEQGTLSDADTFRGQVSRLLEQSCARETLHMLWDEWLGLDRLSSMTHDPTVFPEYTPEMGSGMAQETYAYLDHMMFEANASLEEVFSADYSWLNPEVAPLYGLAGANGKTTLPPERHGLLTHPSLLSLWSLPNQTSPIKRGAHIVINVLCGRLPPQPEGLSVVPPALDPNATTRERYAQHRANPVCAACHQSIDPPGFALEDFDALGRHRTTENGFPIDARGGIPILGVDDLTVNGGAELAAIVARAPELGVCFTRRVLRFALGRGETAEDLTAAKPVLDLIESGAGLRDILVATLMTHPFLHRPPLAGD